MSTNEVYKIKYDTYAENKFWINDPIGVFIRGRIDREFGDAYNEELTEAHRALWPRRKKISLHNLPEETINPIKEKWQAIAMGWLTETRQEHEDLIGWLNENAEKVRLHITSPKTLRTANISTYSSQASAAEKYARGVLAYDCTLLEAAGYTAEIVKGDNGECRLVANCERYILDALNRRGFNEMDWAITCWRNGVNPKVYNAWLDDDIFEKSMRLR